jgi:hypothetical protein
MCFPFSTIFVTMQMTEMAEENNNNNIFDCKWAVA